MIPTLDFLFYASLALIAYAYVGFPLLVLLRAAVIRRPWKQEPQTPSVSFIICCHNEERGIRDKILNLLELDYPREQLQVLIASDGSTDATEEIVAEYEEDTIHLLRLPRTGKAGALNAAVAQATGEILVFSDANSLFARDAVRNLVRHFADPQIGCVAGNQCYQKQQRKGATDAGERGYWDFDRVMKLLQSRAGSAISATGAIYAMRRCLFMPVPEGVTDDFVISTRVIAQGSRLVFDEEAKCFEPVASGVKSEFRRKTRIITRGLTAVLVMRELLNPFRFGFYAVDFFSHKVLRRLVAIPLVVLAITSPLLWNQGLIFQVFTAGQAICYGAALLGWVVSRFSARVPKPLSVPLFFCMVNLAVLIAVKNLLTGKRITVWNPHREEGSVNEAANCEEQARTPQEVSV